MTEGGTQAIDGPALVKLVSSVVDAASAGDRERSVDGMKQLTRFSVTTSLLLSTGAGKKVRKLAKSDDPLIAKAADGVVAAWKEAVKREQGADMRRTSSGATNSQPSSNLPKSDSAPLPSAEQGAAPSQPSNPAASLPNPRVPTGGPARVQPQGQSTQNRAVLGASAANDIFIPSRPAPAVQRPAGNGAGMVPPKTGVGARDTMRQLLTDALAKALPDVDGGEPGTVAGEVETALHSLGGGVTAKYKAKFRSLSFNLKDVNNPDLRRAVLAREIDAQALMRMSPEELASNSRKEENAKIREHALWDAERGPSKKATTDQFQCGKCRQRKCTYYQMQTRSADEPMTTFVTCLNCDKRWKFS